MKEELRNLESLFKTGDLVKVVWNYVVGGNREGPSLVRIERNGVFQGIKWEKNVAWIKLFTNSYSTMISTGVIEEIKPLAFIPDDT